MTAEQVASVASSRDTNDIRPSLPGRTHEPVPLALAGALIGVSGLPAHARSRDQMVDADKLTWQDDPGLASIKFVVLAAADSAVIGFALLSPLRSRS